MDWPTKRVAVFFSGVLVVGVFAILQINQAWAAVSNRLSGRILLQVEARGEAWYVNPVDQKRYFLGRPVDAFQLMRSLGLGITNVNLAKIPEAESTGQGDQALRRRLSGRILLQVESRGEAWYVNPVTLRRHLLGRPSDAGQLMRSLGLGITNANLRLIVQGQLRGGVASSPLFSRIIRSERSSSIATCDTDGGFNIYTAGTVTTRKSGNLVTLQDNCADNQSLHEQYCTSEQYGGGTALVRCLGACRQGACTHADNTNKCKAFPVGRPEKERAINIVVVGAGYSNLEEFIPWVKAEFVSNFFSVEPWKSNQDAFNFYYVDAVAPFDGQGNFSFVNTLPLTEHCQKSNKAVVVLINGNFDPEASYPPTERTLSDALGTVLVAGRNMPEFTDSKGNFNPAHFAVNTRAILHELGHSVGGLRDEYYEAGRSSGISIPAQTYLNPNCFSRGIPTTQGQCLAEAPWKDLIPLFPESVGCFEGCYYKNENVYRPTSAGIMRLHDNQEYGIAEERALCCSMLKLTGSVSGSCNRFHESPLNLVEYCNSLP